MKVLVLNGSPKKKSDTFRMAEAFLRGLNKNQEHEVQIVNVIDKKIAPCRGCFGCWQKLDGHCVIEDDQNALLDIYREADLVIAASGQIESIGTDYFRPLPPEAGTADNGQVVIDVGIGWNDVKNKLCGDVYFDEVEPLVSAITPVPGGVGAVTTAVLALQTVEAALRRVL